MTEIKTFLQEGKNRVAEFANSNLLSCPPHASLAEAARLMRERACSSILVTEEDRPVGIWTERDATRIDFADPAAFDLPVSSVMSKPVATISADAEAGEAVMLLEQARIRHLVVVDGSGKAVGIVTQTDLVLRYGVEHFLRLRTVGEVAGGPPLCLPATLGIGEAVVRMRGAACDAALVERQDGVLGILTERDLIRLLAGRETPPVLQDIASFPLRTVPATWSLLEARRLLIDGHIRHLGITGADGTVIGLLGLHDILLMLQRSYQADLIQALHQRDEALTRFREDLSLARQVIDSSVNALMILDAGGIIRSVNPAFSQLTGYCSEEAVGRTPDELLFERRARVRSCRELCVLVERDGHWRGHLWGRNKAGEPRAYAMSIHAVIFDGRPSGHYAASFFDETEKTRAEQLLREERDLIATGPVVVFRREAREGWPVSYVSPNVAAVFGHEPQDLLAGRPTFLALVHPGDRERVLAEVRRHLEAGDANFQQHYRFRRGDGAWRWIDDYTSVVRDANGRVTGLNGYILDVTERRSAEDRLRLAASVFSCANEGILITDPDGRIVDVNHAFCRITGYAREEVIGRSPKLLQSGRQGAPFYAAMWRNLMEQGQWSGELWNRRKDGAEYAEALTISAVRDESGRTQHYVGLISDITRQKNHQRELERIAHYDPLTGLPNRILLADRMGVALARSRRTGEALAVCVMDLDGFKPVNDTLGHKAGDCLLQEIAARLQATIREEDTVARVGGDEFVLLLGGFRSDSDHEPLLRRIIAAVASPITIEGRPVRVSASIGFTLFPGDPAEADQLLRHADQAMYAAKAQGKNRFHRFDPAAESRLHASRDLLARLDEAIVQRQFLLHYQPKVNCRSGRVVGVEALLRWDHPELGLSHPGDFLSDFEQDEAIVRVGDWVIAEVLRQMAAWDAAGVRIAVSFNVSARQLLKGGLDAYVLEQLGRHPAELAGRLTIEVVETAALEDVQAVCRIMARLQPLGIRFSLDDFGTGYSTLLHLKQLPVNELKIDAAFVRDMLGNPGDFAIVNGVAGLAKAFARDLVAEGVEGVEQIHALRELGCDVVQGYAIAPPMRADELLRWLADFRPDARWQSGDGSGQRLSPPDRTGSSPRDPAPLCPAG
ncbi:EAL domain-containing protein [Caldimonas tepidiphila]|uniref:EAL domain-containing protein n=1 Tax=Caldimonas tepidiphila TaxID=2315841 RepID=UPI001475F46F|nr:EAL domain-containing protein [Caldimonas tepidiphila]